MARQSKRRRQDTNRRKSSLDELRAIPVELEAPVSQCCQCARADNSDETKSVDHTRDQLRGPELNGVPSNQEDTREGASIAMPTDVDRPDQYRGRAVGSPMHRYSLSPG